MKTAKQINNLHTGEIVPIVIETDGNAIKPMTKFHAMSCGVCGKPMTVIKCNDCQHKADLEEWKREKQEMWKELLTALQGREPIEALKIIRHKWGIE